MFCHKKLEIEYNEFLFPIFFIFYLLVTVSISCIDGGIKKN